jgi:hypothetical protein
MTRMNATLPKLILGLTLTSLTLTSCGRQIDRRGQGNDTHALKPEDRPLSLNQFERIHGTPYLMAEITEAQAQRSGSSSSYSQNGTTRNLMFLDGESLASHKLFDTDAYVILATTPYPSQDKANESETRSDQIVTQWLVYQVVKSDTNGDGKLDALDHQTIGVTDASGTGYAEVLSSLDQFLGMTMLSPGQVVVVYSRGGAKSASLIDLGNRKIVSTKALADLGPDVK